ncbi:NAD(P)-dependent alcohol dehydrogenase [Demequina mangrovi]|uniref:NAD(P)-dependent alcohol dehydrogenase n=1 Tax=Demequina mangrovi TaxID=1043493 RepID=UPI00191C3E53|nr:NAD(P)-dependent alcohol dehydrogenase [Demequina mangrovi]
MPVPVPASDEVLVRVHATSVTRGDVVLRKMPGLVIRAFGERPKKVLGHDFAGVVVAVGDEALGFAPGSRVMGTTSGTAHGAHAELLAVPAEGMIVEIPGEASFAEAAPVPVGAMTALHLLSEAGVGKGQRVLVNGASGSVGSYAVQIAKARGARVTAVCSGRNADLVRGLGAEEVVDYTTADVTALGRRFDIVLDAVGTLRKRAARALLADGGAYATTRSRRDETLAELMEVRDLLASGALHAVVDRVYDLEDVPAAHARVEGGHKRGNVLVRVRAEDEVGLA